MSAKKISLCICTYRPDLSKLARVLDALSRQTLPPHQWELLLIENSQATTLDPLILSPLPCSTRLLHEPNPGKVNAMALAAGECTGDWIVFVDDDNLLAADYLEKLIELDKQFPKIGVISASITGEFESMVPPWAEPYLQYLAIRPLRRGVWGNIPGPHIGPIGAAMAVRRPLFEEFARRWRMGAVSPRLGRKAGSLAAGTDDSVFQDIAFDLDYGCGAFPELSMIHLIPSERLKLDYLRKLVRDITKSHAIMALDRGWRPAFADYLRLVRAVVNAVFQPTREQRLIEFSRIKGRLVAYRKANAKS